MTMLTTVKRALIVATAVCLTAGTAAYAQQAERSGQKADKQEKPAPPPPEGQPINLKIDVTITDQAGPGEPGKRTVSMIVADRKMGNIRSSGTVGRYVATLNVDATPTILKGGEVRLELGLEYSPKPTSENAATGEGRANLHERLTLIVAPGKTMTISQASDPTSDRKIMIELLATIVK